MQHLGFCNLYEQKLVCVYCRAMYHKINHFRLAVETFHAGRQRQEPLPQKPQAYSR